MLLPCCPLQGEFSANGRFGSMFGSMALTDRRRRVIEGFPAKIREISSLARSRTRRGARQTTWKDARADPGARRHAVDHVKRHHFLKHRRSTNSSSHDVTDTVPKSLQSYLSGTMSLVSSIDELVKCEFIQVSTYISIARGSREG